MPYTYKLYRRGTMRKRDARKAAKASVGEGEGGSSVFVEELSCMGKHLIPQHTSTVYAQSS